MVIVNCAAETALQVTVHPKLNGLVVEGRTAGGVAQITSGTSYGAKTLKFDSIPRLKQSFVQKMIQIMGFYCKLCAFPASVRSLHMRLFYGIVLVREYL